jgi:hypothetical protein
LQVDRVEVVRPMVLETLLQLMADKYKDAQRYVIWSHGASDGFLMPLVSEHLALTKPNGAPKIQARAHVLRALMQVAEVKADVRRLEEEEQRAGQDAQKHQAVLDGWRALVRKVGLDTPVGSPSAGRQAVRGWLGRQFPTLMLSEARTDQLIGRMNAVRALVPRDVEVRACSLGAHRPILHLYRQFFGALLLGAPRVLSGFGDFNLQGSIGPAPFEAFVARHPNARRFGKPEGLTGGRVAVDIRWRHLSETEVSTRMDTFCAATSRAAVQEWVTRFLVAGAAKYQPEHFPIHFLKTEPPSYQGDDAYWRQMEYASVGDDDEPPDSLFHT